MKIMQLLGIMSRAWICQNCYTEQPKYSMSPHSVWLKDYPSERLYVCATCHHRLTRAKQIIREAKDWDGLEDNPLHKKFAVINKAIKDGAELFLEGEPPVRISRIEHMWVFDADNPDFSYGPVGSIVVPEMVIDDLYKQVAE